ncbi:MAG: hypothetical protein AUI14_14065 [Actinobacteria bacterium 13_2_20CM_2_71_6]|nr:MAG: hypothetical protein AUI14_14065 [Actinobacteria bacterium 13_2_20CM_2_71_6]
MSLARSMPTIASGAASSTAWKRASARSRSLKSRAVLATPMIFPSLSVSGDTASDTLITVPSRRSRRVRYRSSRAPWATSEMISRSSPRRSSGMMRSAGRPSISTAGYP